MQKLSRISADYMFDEHLFVVAGLQSQYAPPGAAHFR